MRCKGYPLIEFSKNKSHSAEKFRRGSIWSYFFWKHLLLEASKICGLVREANQRSPASQKISWTNEQNIVRKWTIQSEIVS